MFSSSGTVIYSVQIYNNSSVPALKKHQGQGVIKTVNNAAGMSMHQPHAFIWFYVSVYLLVMC